MWLGLCIGLDCGEIALRVSQPGDGEPELHHFLGVQSPRPHVKPWIRLFRRLTALPALLPLRSTDAPCWSCDETDLVMAVPLSGAQRLWDAGLCLRCGAVMVRCMPVDGGSPSNVYGGVDWETPDEAVLLLRHGIRTLEHGGQADDAFGRGQD
jgi:hypothetical protein